MIKILFNETKQSLTKYDQLQNFKGSSGFVFVS